MSKTKGLVQEFKEFIMRGNVMDLAIAVIIGGAFQKIIASLVDDVIMPLITLITGGINFNDWFISLDGSTYDTLEKAKAAGASTLNYGVFLTAIINFLLIGLVIFFLVKALNKMAERKNQEQEEAAPTVKTCPYCKSEISIDATRCPNCTSQLEE